MKPGLYQMTDPEYRAIEALNWSKLSPYYKSALEGHDREVNPMDQTPAMLFGIRAHMFILEPEVFDQTHIFEPKDLAMADKRTKAGKELKATFMAEAGNREVVSFADQEKLVSMKHMFLTHPLTEGILEDAQVEQVAIWDDGVRKKAKLDIVSDGVLYDYKTTTDDLARWPNVTVYDRRYHGQIAYYHQGLSAVSGVEIKEVKFIVQNTVAPFDLCVFDANGALEEGRRMVQFCEQRYLEAVSMSYWAPYSLEEKTLGECPAWLRV